MQNRRNQLRREIVRPVIFPGDTEPMRFAFSVNISHDGLCLITNRKISPGQTMEVMSKFFWDRPIEARAVWCQEINHTVTRAGFSFV